MIYTSANIKSLLFEEKFRKKVKQGGIYGTYNYPVFKFPKVCISHIVRDAFISDDNEIMFEIETLDNDVGRSLAAALEESEYSVLAKIVAEQSKTIINGKINVIKILFVHMVKHEPSYLKKN